MAKQTGTGSDAATVSSGAGETALIVANDLGTTRILFSVSGRDQRFDAWCADADHTYRLPTVAEAQLLHHLTATKTVWAAALASETAPRFTFELDLRPASPSGMIPGREACEVLAEVFKSLVEQAVQRPAITHTARASVPAGRTGGRWSYSIRVCAWNAAGLYPQVVLRDPEDETASPFASVRVAMTASGSLHVLDPRPPDSPLAEACFESVRRCVQAHWAKAAGKFGTFLVEIGCAPAGLTDDHRGAVGLAVSTLSALQLGEAEVAPGVPRVARSLLLDKTFNDRLQLTVTGPGVWCWVRVTYDAAPVALDRGSGTIGSVSIEHEPANQPTDRDVGKGRDEKSGIDTLQTPPLPAVLDLIARSQSSSEDERRAAAVLMPAAAKASREASSQVANRLTLMLMDGSPQVAIAAWRSIVELSASDPELSAKLQLLRKLAGNATESTIPERSGAGDVTHDPALESRPAASAHTADRRLTAVEAAERLKISKSLVLRYAREKRIGEKVGHQYLFSVEELDTFASQPRLPGRPRHQEPDNKSEEKPT